MSIEQILYSVGIPIVSVLLSGIIGFWLGLKKSQLIIHKKERKKLRRQAIEVRKKYINKSEWIDLPAHNDQQIHDFNISFELYLSENQKFTDNPVNPKIKTAYQNFINTEPSNPVFKDGKHITSLKQFYEDKIKYLDELIDLF